MKKSEKPAKTPAVKVRSNAVRVKTNVRAGDLYMQNPRGNNDPS